MTRKKRCEEELRRASDSLWYEIWMLSTLTKGLESDITGQGVIHNALLESFSFHALSLYNFLYPRRPRQDEVIAGDFFSDPTEWNSIRPEGSINLRKAAQGLGKEAENLTYGRRPIKEEMKKISTSQIGSEIIFVCRLFINKVPQHLLGPRWEEHFKSNHGA